MSIPQVSLTTESGLRVSLSYPRSDLFMASLGVCELSMGAKSISLSFVPSHKIFTLQFDCAFVSFPISQLEIYQNFMLQIESSKAAA